MMDDKMKKLLGEDMPEVPDSFRAAMASAFDQMEERSRPKRNVPFWSLRGMRRAAVILAAVLILSTVAVAAIMAPRLVAIFWGDEVPTAEGIDQYLAHDLAQTQVGQYRVRVDEAIYDGVALYVQYSLRDMEATERLGQYNEKWDEWYLPETEDGQSPLASWPVGYWRDGFWIDGKDISMPGLSSDRMVLTETPGEVVYYAMYRLDQEDIWLSGKVKVSLPIGLKPNWTREETRAQYDEDGGMRLPEANVLTFELDCDVPRKIIKDGQATNMPDGTQVWVSSAVFTPVKLYLTLNYTADEEGLARIIEETGIPEEFAGPYLVMNDWAYGGLRLTDGSGKLVNVQYDIYDGCEGLGDEDILLVMPYAAEYPNPLYIAPLGDNGEPDMTRAVLIPQ